MRCGNLVAFSFTGGSVMSRPIFILSLCSGFRQQVLAGGEVVRGVHELRQARVGQGEGLAVAGGLSGRLPRVAGRAE